MEIFGESEMLLYNVVSQARSTQRESGYETIYNVLNLKTKSNVYIFSMPKIAAVFGSALAYNGA